MLQAEARELLSRQGSREGLKYGWDYHRTAKCKFALGFRDTSAGVYRSVQHGAAFFTGLFTCGSVWVCPVCCAKVQEKRRLEVAQAIEWAYRVPVSEAPPLGYRRERDARSQPVMVTLTFPHRAWHDLGELLDRQAEALDLLRTGSPWRRWVQASGYEGLIRALELTHGRHGWHPHTHELWFVSPTFDASTMRERITQFWVSACKRAGLLDAANENQLAWFAEHAVDVKAWCSASDYLAKGDDARHWGVDREMAKASTKEAKKKGTHPFGLLAKAMEGDEKSGRLFVTFARTVTERRKRQLYWSPGLKGLTGVAERTDEQLAEESTEQADLLGCIELDDWRLVRRYRAQSDVLDAAELGGWSAVESVLDRLFVAEYETLAEDLRGRVELDDWRLVRRHRASAAVLAAAKARDWRAVEAQLERVIVAECERLEERLAAENGNVRTVDDRPPEVPELPEFGKVREVRGGALSTPRQTVASARHSSKVARTSSKSDPGSGQIARGKAKPKAGRATPVHGEKCPRHSLAAAPLQRHNNDDDGEHHTGEGEADEA